MAAFAILAVVLTVLLFVTKDYRARIALRSELLTLGASYARVDADRRAVVVFIQPIGSADFSKFQQLHKLELQHFPVDAATLQAFSGLQQIDTLLLKSCSFADAQAWSQLSQNGNVRSLLFWGSPVDDSFVDMIATVPGIERVYFVGTQLTPAGADQLRLARPEIQVELFRMPGSAKAPATSK
jgi:hypothetical protein